MKTFVIHSYALLGTIFAIAMCNVNITLNETVQICLAEANLTEAQLQNFLSNGMKPEEAKANIKCHMKCVMEKQGHMNAGVFNATALVESLKQRWRIKENYSKIERILQICQRAQGINDCDTAYLITRCMKEQNATLSPKSFF